MALRKYHRQEQHAIPLDDDKPKVISSPFPLPHVSVSWITDNGISGSTVLPMAMEHAQRFVARGKGRHPKWTYRING